MTIEKITIKTDAGEDKIHSYNIDASSQSLINELKRIVSGKTKGAKLILK
jgi:hypothetical protein